MSQAAKTDLLFGPYTAPALRRGDRTVCLVRDADVVITSWSAGRIPWPRCQVIGQRGGSGLLVDEELARTELFEPINPWPLAEATVKPTRARPARIARLPDT